LPLCGREEMHPRMAFGKPASQAGTALLGQKRDHLARVLVVLWSRVLALEQKLEVGSQVGDALGGLEHRLIPRNSYRGVTPVDPGSSVSLVDRDIDAPRRTRRSAAPDVVLAQIGSQGLSTPWSQGLSPGAVEVPAPQKRA